MTTEEAAEKLGWHINTVEKWAKIWMFPKYGRDYWIDDHLLERLRNKKDRRRRENTERYNKKAR